MKFDRHIFTLLFAASMLAATACSQDIPMLGEEPGEVVSPDDDGMVDVVLNVSLESSTADDTGTRADGGDFLKNLDLFIYVLRDEDNNIMKQYGKGFLLGDDWQQGDDESNEEYIKRLKIEFPAFADYKLADDNNQTLMLTKWEKIGSGSDGVNRYRMTDTIKLRVLRGTVFKFSCWAQSSKSTAYNFNYLTALKVNYGEMKANSDINDAYCATSIFSVGQYDTSVSVTLSRPFAQINIGIGTDILDKEGSLPIGTSDGYSYSKFTISGLATAFDVVKNKVWNSETIKQYNNKAGYAEYANYSDNLFEFERGKVSDSDLEGYIESYVNSTLEMSYSELPGLGDDGTDATLTVFDFSDWVSGSGKITEKTYRKLAMAYVLVPDFESVSSGDDGVETVATATSSVKFGTFYIAKDEEGSEAKTYSPKEKDANGDDTDEPLSISVKRNWRTNLLFTDWEWAN